MKGIFSFNDIRNDLKQVEVAVNSYLEVSNPLLTETSSHLMKAGGKRIRPAFVLLAGKFNNYSLEKLLPLAMAMELIHMASLVHDDVIDASQTRRGTPTVKAKWGNRISLQTGDFLFARSLLLVAQYENPVISQVLAKTSVQMCEGEIQQIATAFRADQTTKDYFYRIKRKTALLIAASCYLGAVACGATPDLCRALRLYGHYIGMAFQITDDILDLVADEKELGKPVGSDLRQGIITLPIIYAVARSANKERLVELIEKRKKTEAEVREAISYIVESGAIDYAFSVSRSYVEKAKRQLERLPDIKTKDTLTYIANYINQRRY